MDYCTTKDYTSLTTKMRALLNLWPLVAGVMSTLRPIWADINGDLNPRQHPADHGSHQAQDYRLCLAIRARGLPLTALVC